MEIIKLEKDGRQILISQKKLKKDEVLKELDVKEFKGNLIESEIKHSQDTYYEYKLINLF